MMRTGRWGALALGVSMGLGAAWGGCTGRCQYNTDCPNETFCDQELGRCITECFSNEDCKNRPGCASTEEGCDPIGVVCKDGRCQGEPNMGNTATRVGADEDGYDADPFSGPIFVVDSLALADAGVGFPIEGGTGIGVDNRLAALAPFTNGPVAGGLSQGVTILLVEIAGLVEGFEGDDYAVTLKFYAGEDADNLPGNNFRAPAPGAECCTFRPLASSLRTSGTDRQAVTRARARISGGVVSSLEPFSVNLRVDLGGDQPAAIVIENARIRFEVDDALTRLEGGLLGGAVPMKSLDLIDNPYCRSGGAGCPPVSETGSLLDMVNNLVGRADVDVDGDELECVRDTDGDQEVDLCCIGQDFAGRCERNKACTGTEVESLDPTDPGQCTQRDGFEDGYSAALELTGVKASLL